MGPDAWRCSDMMKNSSTMDRGLVPISRRVVDFADVVNEMADTRRQIALLRVYRPDIIIRRCKIIQHGNQPAPLQIRLDFPGGTPPDAQALSYPLVKHLAIVAVQITLNALSEWFPVTKEYPATLLATLHVESQAIVMDQIFGHGGCTVSREIFWCTTDHALVGVQAGGNITQVGDLAHAYGHVVTLFHQIRHPVRQVDGQLQTRIALAKRHQVRCHMLTAKGRRRGNHQAPGQGFASGAHAAVGGFNVLEDLV